MKQHNGKDAAYSSIHARVEANVATIQDLCKEVQVWVASIGAEAKCGKADWGTVGTLAHIRQQLNEALGYNDEDPHNVKDPSDYDY